MPKGPFDPKKLYSIKEVAYVFRVSPMSVLRWIKAGKLRAYGIGGALRVYGSDLIEAATIRPKVESSDEGPKEPPARRKPRA